ncbi:hypothetical protein FDP41_005964 [Naegleria fowleri]|uniref:Uncharacterized protein n=1 Tax=Naegleria fowleri TaxID=5763 RepID=A0A6A5BLI2_NAEFO|nr:uncharacterized protein FDP41_005964 [Naegleria fowleri]KAF0975211.1 hypothetical protein FDP41_005964 [Naegleria fowleri]
MQHIYYYDHGMFIAPTKNMITVYNKLYSEYIDFDDFKKLPFDVILYILTFIKFPEIIFYSKKLIETAHYSDLYEKMLLYEETASSMSNLKELTSDTHSSTQSNSQPNTTINNTNNSSSLPNGESSLCPPPPSLKKSSSSCLHKRSISPSSASLTKSIPFSLQNVMSKLFGVFEKERNQRLFLFDFYAHLKFIGFDQMLALYNSFYRDYSSTSYNSSIFVNYNNNHPLNPTNNHLQTNSQQSWQTQPQMNQTNSSPNGRQLQQETTNFTHTHSSSSSSQQFSNHSYHSNPPLLNTMLSPRSSCKRLRISYDDDFLSMLTASPSSFENLLSNRQQQQQQQHSLSLLEDTEEQSHDSVLNPLNSFSKPSSMIPSLHSHLPKHLRHVVKSVKRLSNEYHQQSQQQQQFYTLLNSNPSLSIQQQRRRSKSLGSAQIAIQIRKKIEEHNPKDSTMNHNNIQEEEGRIHEGFDDNQTLVSATTTTTQPQDSTRSKHRFSIQFYQVRNFFYIPFIQSVTFSNCSNQANYYIHFVVLPFFTFNNHLKSFKLIDCQLSQETIQELYFQLRSMFVEMHKNGKLSAPCYPSLRELSLADNDVFHYCSWHFLFPNLRTLDLSGNKPMMGPSMCKLLTKDIESFKHLKRLNLSNGAFDSNMIIRSNSLRELDVFDIRQPMNITQLENQIVNHCKKIRLIKYYSAQEKKLVKWVRED